MRGVSSSLYKSLNYPLSWCLGKGEDRPLGHDAIGCYQIKYESLLIRFPPATPSPACAPNDTSTGGTARFVVVNRGPLPSPSLPGDVEAPLAVFRLPRIPPYCARDSRSLWVIASSTALISCLTVSPFPGLLRGRQGPHAEHPRLLDGPPFPSPSMIRDRSLPSRVRFAGSDKLVHLIGNGEASPRRWWGFA